MFSGADASDAFKAWSEDVDHAGHNSPHGLLAAFEAGLRDGVAFALADYSRVRTRMEGGVLKYFDEGTGEWLTKTADADAMNGWSPYLVHVPAASVIDCWIETIGGKPVVTMFRYLETAYESDGTEFGRERVDRIRVLMPGSVGGLHEEGRGQGLRHSRRRRGHYNTLSRPSGYLYAR